MALCNLPIKEYLPTGTATNIQHQTKNNQNKYNPQTYRNIQHQTKTTKTNINSQTYTNIIKEQLKIFYKL